MPSLAPKCHSTLASTWHQSGNLWKGGVALCRMVSEGLHLQPCAWSLSADAGKWLVFCLYGYHRENKILDQCQVRSQPACKSGIILFIFLTLWKHCHAELIRLSWTRSPQMSRLHFINLNSQLLKWGQSDPPCASLYQNNIKRVSECNICTEVFEQSVLSDTFNFQHWPINWCRFWL